jgi:hypothetical protein
MRIKLDEIDPFKFSVKEKDGLFLINPNQNYTDWKKGELIFRSSIWNKNGYLVSAGFKKFFNWDEEKELSKQPNNLIGTTAMEKLDGSLLICSYYEGKFIYRTRGTFDAYQFANSDEIDMFREKYNLDNILKIGCGEESSLLFEWTTPSNKIVIPYNEPDIRLVGSINHEDYYYATQKELDDIAKLMRLKRPKTYEFSSIENLLSVKDWVGDEGVCLYYNNDQSIVKIKSLDYLKKHSFKSHLNWERLVDMYLEWRYSSKYETDEFFIYLEKLYDFEIRKFVEENYKDRLLNCVSHFIDTVEDALIYYQVNGELDRKDYAIKLQSEFKDRPFVIQLAFAYLNQDRWEEIQTKLKRKFYINYENN